MEWAGFWFDGFDWLGWGGDGDVVYVFHTAVLGTSRSDEKGRYSHCLLWICSVGLLILQDLFLNGMPLRMWVWFVVRSIVMRVYRTCLLESAI